MHTCVKYEVSKTNITGVVEINVTEMRNHMVTK